MAVAVLQVGPCLTYATIPNEENDRPGHTHGADVAGVQRTKACTMVVSTTISERALETKKRPTVQFEPLQRYYTTLSSRIVRVEPLFFRLQKGGVTGSIYC